VNAALIVVGWVPKNHPPPSGRGTFRENGASKRCAWGQSNINQNQVLRLSWKERKKTREREREREESKWGEAQKKGGSDE